MIETNKTGPVRRADFYLRTEFPEFTTTIYRIHEEDFLIYVPGIGDKFGSISKKFQEELKPIVLSVQICKTKPKKYIEIIPPISDKEISLGLEGILMSKVDWINFLSTKFPKINFYKITDADGIVNLHIANYKVKDGKITNFVFLDLASRKALEDFLKRHNSPLKFNIIVDEFEEKPILASGFEADTNSYTFIKDLKAKPQFVQRDESLWVDNVDDIFLGNFRKENLFFWNPDEYSCYVDFSVFPNLDLRYFLMLYETSYLTPPLEKSVKDWLKDFGVKCDEFIQLILRKRIRLVLPQDFSRYDVGFLNEVYRLMPDAIISKRAVSCLQQCDIVEVSDNYIFNTTDCLSEMRKFCSLISNTNKVDADFLYKLVVWPVTARRQSFEVLHRTGVLSASLYGVNKIISKTPNNNISESVNFLMTGFSPSIHLAHSLNATYFPYQMENSQSDENYADVMGKLLNFFKSATLENFKDLEDDELFLRKGNSFISPVDLVKMNTFDSILEFEEVLSKEIVFPNSRRLMETLSVLSPEEQAQKVRFYNREVQKYLRTKESSYKIFDFSVQCLDVVLGLTTSIPFGPIFTGIKFLSKGKFSPIKHIYERLEEAMNPGTDRRNIHFLSKINRVAKLREEL